MSVPAGATFDIAIEGTIAGVHPFTDILSSVGREMSDAGLFGLSATGDAPDFVPGIGTAVIGAIAPYIGLSSRFSATLTVQTRQDFDTPEAIAGVVTRAFQDQGATVSRTIASPAAQSIFAGVGAVASSAA